MQRLFKLFICIGCVVVTPFYAEVPKESVVHVVNSLEEPPRRFHFVNGAVTLEKICNPLGLDKLRASSSAQFSANQMRWILQSIDYKNIIFIDLRLEWHAFDQGNAINWRTTESSILEQEGDAIRHLRERSDHPDAILSEEELVAAEGAQYMRIPVSDHTRPTNEQVEQFVQFIQQLPTDTWLHFHCAGGSGRSTVMTILYDMMMNADTVSFEDILLRQHLLGGKNLLSPPDANDWRFPLYQERIALLEQFYQYCQEQIPHHFSLSWHEWSRL